MKHKTKAISGENAFVLNEKRYRLKFELFIEQKTDSVFFSETAQEHRKNIAGILIKRVFTVADTPVVDQSAFAEGVCLDELVYADIIAQFAFALPFDGDLTDQAEVCAAVVHKMLFACGDELG